MKKNAYPKFTEASALDKSHSSGKPSPLSTRPTNPPEGDICQGGAITDCDSLKDGLEHAYWSTTGRKSDPANLREEG